ncbi:MAG TPA: asparagine synthetase B [archaeon]|nr:asparagine synthetase B [archaeon]
MCSIIGVYSKNNEDISNEVRELFSLLAHRGPEAFGIKTIDSLETSVSLKGLSFPTSSVYLGHCLLSTTGYLQQPVSKANVSIVLNGEIYNYVDFGNAYKSDSEFVADFFSKELKKNSVPSSLKNFVKKSVGEYAIAFMFKNKLYAFRDPIGTKPLWFGENKSLFAFASEPNALKKIGILSPISLKPGFLLEVSQKSFSVKKIFDLKDFKKTVPRKHSIQFLKDSFDETIELQTNGLEKAAVLFSGGVDSSLVAKAVSEKVKNAKLFVAGTKDSHDIIEAEKAAKELNLPLEKIILSEEKIHSLALECEKILGFFDSMQIAIAVPELACAKKIKENGFKVVFSGQGSDELFCGYTNYTKILGGKNYSAVEKEIWFSLERMPERNFYRDDIILSSQALELRLPLMLAPFVKEAMAFPAKEKILAKNDALRKHPIRKLASLYNIPDSIVSKPKKALQYGSGSQKIVSKLFRNRC